MRRLIVLFFLLFALSACQSGRAVPTPAITASPALPSATPTLPDPTATPSPTPLPPALRVNGETVPLAEYAASLGQLEAAQPDLDPAARRQAVLDDLVDQTLLSQAARQAANPVDDNALQQRIAALAAEVGGEQALADWQTAMGYTPESFRSALRRSVEAAWMRDQVLASVPAEMEQVHARQILLRTEEGARRVEAEAKTPGTNFATLAAGYDLATRGDLYWFPRGYLSQPAVEEAAFNLQPGEISGVIRSDIGYHILQVVARETRPLSADVRAVLQRKALADWLNDQRRSAQIEVLVP
jgi:peptidyl-prolyl cis-trans isomerase C